MESGPEGEADFAGAEFSRATRELVATRYIGDRMRLYPRDPQFARDYQRVRTALPDGDRMVGCSAQAPAPTLQDFRPAPYQGEQAALRPVRLLNREPKREER